MASPYLVVVDDDPVVLAAVGRDLRRKYGEDYRVVPFPSGEEALEGLRQLKLQGDAVALILADQRMPGITGVDLLAASRDLYPETRRALLTAYADTDAAIDAINKAGADHYILKPWDPPEERLFPVLDDLLERWESAYVTMLEGTRVVGSRWSRPFHDLQAFLIRNQVPFSALDVVDDPEALRQLAVAGRDPSELPVVLLPDGSSLVAPSPAEVAERVGLTIHPANPSYDLVIVGAGPAGLAAAVYAASEGLGTLLVDGEAPGGQAGQSARIENYLGFPNGLSGAELARRAVTQAKRFGAEILIPVDVVSLQIDGPYKKVQCGDGTELVSRALVVATGVSYRRLDVPGADSLAGAGVYYGASRVEAQTHRDEEVLILGGGNSAGQAAVYLSGFAAKVTIMVLAAGLEASMSAYLIEQLNSIENIELLTQVQVTEVHGGDRMEGVTLRHLPDGPEQKIPAAALFVFIGQAPRTEWVGDLVMRDPQGFILTGADCGPKPAGWTLGRPPLPLESSLPGVFAAGDVRHSSMKRVASAVGEGAMAVSFVHKHLAGSPE